MLSADDGTIPNAQLPAVFQSDEMTPIHMLTPCWDIIKVLDVAEVRDPEDDIRVYPEPALSILKSSNVAIPLTTTLSLVPDSMPLEGLVPMAIWILVVLSPILTLPYWSDMATFTLGDITAPSRAPEGCWVYISFVAVVGLTVMDDDTPVLALCVIVIVGVWLAL